MKKFISLLVTVAMLAAMTAVMPITASAEAADFALSFRQTTTTSGIWNLYAGGGGTLYTAQTDNWQIVEDTLILKDGFYFETTDNYGLRMNSNNLKMEGNVTIIAASGGGTSNGNAIDSAADIEVTGNALVKSMNNSRSYVNAISFLGFQGIGTIRGTGTLTAEVLAGNTTNGINGVRLISGDVTVIAKGGNVAEGTTSSNNPSSGIRLGGDSLTIKDNAKVTAIGGNCFNSYGIYSEGTQAGIIITDNAEVTATGGEATISSAGIQVRADVTIGGNAIATLTGGDVSRDTGECSSYGLFVDLGSVEIKENATVTATGGDVSDTSGLSTGTGRNRRSSGIVAQRDIIISGTATVTATGGSAQTSHNTSPAESYGIRNGAVTYNNPKEIIISGTPTITAIGGSVSAGNPDNEFSAGIVLSDSSTTGPNSLTVDIDGGKIAAKGATYAIYRADYNNAGSHQFDYPNNYGIWGINTSGKYTIAGELKRMNPPSPYNGYYSVLDSADEVIKDLIIFTADEDVNCDEGHTFGTWTESLPAVGTYKEVDVRSCSVCNLQEFTNRVDSRDCGEGDYVCGLIACKLCNTQPPKTGFGDYSGFAVIAVALVGTSAGLWFYSRRRVRN
ncbi:MAG: carbohydrate-binding domain-containing protein [Oscillospiraceae bacterium]|nr:carbohydrate-binding domain-containing protein [Oscillospiraceae bacterium]